MKLFTSIAILILSLSFVQAQITQQEIDKLPKGEKSSDIIKEKSSGQFTIESTECGGNGALPSRWDIIYGTGVSVIDNNTIIGDLHLEGLTPRPRGETSIEVTFSLDASGILRVKARDAQTGREQQASLDLVGGVPEENVAASREKLQQLRR